MAVYAVGDIQGCLKPLQCLLRKVDFNPSRDTLWAVGDLVNRGPDSLQTLRFLEGLGNAFITVLGNHDLHLLACAQNPGRLRRSDTLMPILDAPANELLRASLRQRPLAPSDPHRNTLMTNAAIPPTWPLKKTCALPAEVAPPRGAVRP